MHKIRHVTSTSYMRFFYIFGLVVGGFFTITLKLYIKLNNPLYNFPKLVIFSANFLFFLFFLVFKDRGLRRPLYRPLDMSCRYLDKQVDVFIGGFNTLSPLAVCFLLSDIADDGVDIERDTLIKYVCASAHVTICPCLVLPPWAWGVLFQVTTYI